MENKVIICIGTIGSPTFNRCYSLINKYFKKHPNVYRISIIKNKKPRSSWLNEMAKESLDYDWCLQVDEDMYLYPEALDELLTFAIKNKNDGVKIANASSMLEDLFLDQKIGSLKLWNTEVFKHVKFKDVLGSDRQFAKDAAEFGFVNISFDKILADHDSAPTPAIAYKKYFEYTKKIIKFQDKVAVFNFIKNLEKINLNKKTNISISALKGANAAYNNYDNIELPLVSIIMTNFNKNKLLKLSINSVLLQSYKNFELLVIDDNSNDDSIEIIKNINDPRIKLFKTSINYGTYACRNFGILQSSGKYITFLDSDDFIEKDHINKKINKIINLNIKAVCTKYKRYDEFKNQIGKEKICEASILFDKNIIKDIGFFHMVKFGADTEYRLRIEKKYGKNSIFILEDTSYIAFYSKNSLTSNLSTGIKSVARSIYSREFLKNLENNKNLKYDIFEDMSFLKLDKISLVNDFNINTFERIK